MARIFTLGVQRCSIGISAYEVKLILSVLYMNMENRVEKSTQPPHPRPKKGLPPRGVILVGMSLLLMDLLIIAVQEIIDCNLKNDSIGGMNDQI